MIWPNTVFTVKLDKVIPKDYLESTNPHDAARKTSLILHFTICQTCQMDVNAKDCLSIID